MIRCIRFRPYEKNALKGFVDLHLTRVGLIIRGCLWIAKDGEEFVGFPMRSYRDQDGRQWRALIEFAADATKAREQFQAKALEAIHAFVDASRVAP